MCMEHETITGLTIIKNVSIHNYPFKYAYESVKLLLDELIIVVGHSEDNTRDLANDIVDKHGNGRVLDVDCPDGKPKALGQVTNKGLRKCHGDWIYYFQADEFMDHNNISLVRDSLIPGVNSYLFPFIHFFGDIKHVQRNPSYKYAIRLFRNKKFGVSSDMDAWSFTGFKIFSSLQINRIFPTSFLNSPIYHSHNIGSGVKRNEARGDKFNGETIEYSGFVPPELLNFSNTLLKINE